MLSASSLGMAEDEAELLIIAAIHDQVDMLRDMLHAEVHGNVSSVDPWGLTALHHAARNGSHQCLELLLQKDGLYQVFVLMGVSKKLRYLQACRLIRFFKTDLLLFN